MSLENLNHTWFVLINAAPDAAPQSISMATFLSDKVVYIIALGMIIAWVRKSEAFKFVLLDVVVSIVLALIFSWIIGAMWYHPRPFEIGLGQKFIEHATNSSFPSDHATLLFSVALPLLAQTISRSWGMVVLALTLSVAWARVYLGVHFPFDMIGGLVVAAISTTIVRINHRKLRNSIYAQICDY
ncbi:MAG: undecaprenyl-diphosphatase [Amylibacter sp.]